MMLTRRGLRAASVIGLAMIMVTASNASAHHVPLYGPAFVSDSTIIIQVTQGYPGGNFYSRVGSAGHEWNVVGTTRPLGLQAARIANFDMEIGCAPTTGVVAVHWRETTELGFPDGLGVTNYCVFSANPNDRRAANIAIDVNRDWYTGTGDANDGFLGQCVPSCQSDLWSVLSHELGHAMGFDHLSESAPQCGNNSGRHTMCPSIYGGTERQRDYEIHEEESFIIRY
jgi:hypothetical protein